MATNFAELSPQQRGAIVVNAHTNKAPDKGEERLDFWGMRDAALESEEVFGSLPNNGNFKPVGRVNSRKKRKLSPKKYADIIAERMFERGRTPQEVGAVVAGILGFNG